MRKPESRYLRPRSSGGYAESGRRAVFPVARVLPAFVLFGIVGVVLFGGGFWSEGQGRPNLQEQGATETITIPPTETADTGTIPVTVPGGQVVFAAPASSD